jgi:predicted ribosome quality control (RQC) complex YloA/Tae2 family protein
MSSVREVLPGRDYFIPDTMEKLNPLDVSCEDFISTLIAKPVGLAKAIYTGFTGVSPVVSEEICYVAGIDSNVSPKELSEDVLLHLYKQFTQFFYSVLQNKYEPCVYYNGT